MRHYTLETSLKHDVPAYSAPTIDPLPTIDENNGYVLLADEYILPFQMDYLHSSEYRGEIALVGVKGMWTTSFLAGVHEALLCTDSENVEVARKYRKLKKEAIKWIHSRGDFMSFEWYCTILDLEEDRAREKILSHIRLEPIPVQFTVLP